MQVVDRLLGGAFTMKGVAGYVEEVRDLLRPVLDSSNYKH